MEGCSVIELGDARCGRLQHISLLDRGEVALGKLALVRPECDLHQVGVVEGGQAGELRIHEVPCPHHPAVLLQLVPPRLQVDVVQPVAVEGVPRVKKILLHKQQCQKVV